MRSLLNIENLSVCFDTEEGAVTAVDKVSLDIPEGVSLGLVGESGCGKTVTALSILRLIPVPPGRITSGRIVFEEKDLCKLPVTDLCNIRGNRISMIFQEPMTALSPLLRIGRQMTEAVVLHNKTIPRKNLRQKVLKALRDVGLPDPAACYDAFPHQLSGGMRQRAMIAMALLLDPDLIIADEPTTALDVTLQAQILALMKSRLRENQSLLLITHDMGVVWQMCEQIAVMYAGQIVEKGATEQIFNHPLHPYTEALLRSIPGLKKTAQRLSVIPGQVPSPFHWPHGCRFQERCPYVKAECRNRMPDMIDCNGQSARCILARQRKEKNAAGN